MPVSQSEYLIALAVRLVEVNTSNGNDPNWKLTAEYCSLHEAEATIIPLGIRDGYPEDIDFRAIEKRLLTGWKVDPLHALVTQPKSSSFFNDAINDIQRIGKIRWNGLDKQSEEKIINSTMPG